MPSNEGGCLCGQIRYRLTGAPQCSIICHCATCRRASGAPTVAWLTVGRSQFELLSGQPLLFRSSAGVLRGFCGACGSALTYENESNPANIDVTTVSLDDSNVFPPTAEVWLEHKVPWQTQDGSLKQFSQGSV
jgi:hypothetical protein